MGNKKDKGFYPTLSRKELQSLCKKYGLPANRSSSDMATSLASFLQNQRLGLMTTRERLFEIQEAGLPLPLQLPFRDAEKDFYGLISCPAGSCNGGNYSQAVKSNALGCCAGDKFHHKVNAVVPAERYRPFHLTRSKKISSPPPNTTTKKKIQWCTKILLDDTFVSRDVPGRKMWML
ncbi:hypothetical protein V6N13_100398 [Hibiscus sabdariffa]